MHSPETFLENETHKLFLDFEIQTDHLISDRRPDLILINKRERTCRIMHFAVLTDHRVKFKECNKRNKDFNLNRELKKENCGTWKLWLYQNGALDTITKELVQGMEDSKITGLPKW